MMAAGREMVWATLILRLAGKGLADHETDLFIQNVMRTVSGPPNRTCKPYNGSCGCWGGGRR